MWTLRESVQRIQEKGNNPSGMGRGEGRNSAVETAVR
jgi:hypothetical protein